MRIRKWTIQTASELRRKYGIDEKTSFAWLIDFIKEGIYDELLTFNQAIRAILICQQFTE